LNELKLFKGRSIYSLTWHRDLCMHLGLTTHFLFNFGIGVDKHFSHSFAYVFYKGESAYTRGRN